MASASTLAGISAKRQIKTGELDVAWFNPFFPWGAIKLNYVHAAVVLKMYQTNEQLHRTSEQRAKNIRYRCAYHKRGCGFLLKISQLRDGDWITQEGHQHSPTCPFLTWGDRQIQTRWRNSSCLIPFDALTSICRRYLPDHLTKNTFMPVHIVQILLANNLLPPYWKTRNNQSSWLGKIAQRIFVVLRKEYPEEEYEDDDYYGMVHPRDLD